MLRTKGHVTSSRLVNPIDDLGLSMGLSASSQLEQVESVQENVEAQVARGCK